MRVATTTALTRNEQKELETRGEFALHAKCVQDFAKHGLLSYFI
jgi:hypothetical protein